MFVTTGNNFNEFWDFYNGFSVPAGSPKATQDAKYPRPPLSRALSGLDSAAGGGEPCGFMQNHAQGRMGKKRSKNKHQTEQSSMDGGVDRVSPGALNTELL